MKYQDLFAPVMKPHFVGGNQTVLFTASNGSLKHF